MTPEQHAQHIRQIAFKLEKADYGLGMPRDYNEVLRLRVMLEDARKDMNNTIKRVITDYIRDHDWCAFYEGEEEAGEYGYGPTEEAAVTDLTTNYPVEGLIMDEHDIRHAYIYGAMFFRDAVRRLQKIGYDAKEADQIVSEWAEAADSDYNEQMGGY